MLVHAQPDSRGSSPRMTHELALATVVYPIFKPQRTILPLFPGLSRTAFRRILSPVSPTEI